VLLRFRYLDLLDDRLLVNKIVQGVPTVRAYPGRQPLAREQIVHANAREPGDP
jgi:hypothetical protein